MKLTDIIGPVMVGPSSSHTAGAVKIGNVCRRLLESEPKDAQVLLHGSFAATGKGHGTDKAIVAGLLGFAVDDHRIADSLKIAEEQGLKVVFGSVDLGSDAHPNSARLDLTGTDGRKLQVEASSVGGGRIRIDKLDGLRTDFSGDYPTLIVHNQDSPGYLAEVTSVLESRNINIANMQLFRSSRGGSAVMVIELDQEVPEEARRIIAGREGILKVTYLGMQGEKAHV